MKRICRAAGAVLVALGAVLIVALVPSTAWSAPPASEATGDAAVGWTTVAGWTLTGPPQGSITATFGAPNGVLNESGKGYAFVPIQHPTYPLGVVQNSMVPTATNWGTPYTATPQIWDVYYGSRSGTLGNPPSGTLSKVGTIWVAPSGGTIANPVANTASTCNAFRHIAPSVQDGSLDLSFGWSGTVPTRGWQVTDAGSKAAVGSGSVLTSIAATALPAPPFPQGSYGLAQWTPPAGVTSLRVQVKGTPGCFTGFTLTRDGSGVLTGVTAIGSGGLNGAPDVPPDLSEADTATDEEGADCSTFDIFCQVKYLFVPDPSSWGFGDTLTQVQGRAPFSLAANLASGVMSIADAYAGADGCGNAPAFPIPGIEMPSTGSACGLNGNSPFGGGDWKDSTAGQLVRTLLSLMLYGLTAFVLWGFAENAFGDRSGDES